MKRTAWSAGLSVSGDGTGVVAHAGSAGLRLLADRTGLPVSSRWPWRGARSFRAMTGAGAHRCAVMLADGGEAIADIDVLRHQSPLLGYGAGASHGLLDWLTEQNQRRGHRVQYSIGFALTEALRQAIMLVPATWDPAQMLTAGCVPVVTSPS